jgi:ABC-type Fe3+-hydroxamate transport system substrate-binding protein
MIFTDQLNNTIELNAFPKRIISIVPSQSELLWDLGLREELVGITKFCIHPKELHQSVTHIGGTKTLNIDKIRSLKPDVIIGNKEENDQAQIESLQKEFKVWTSDIFTLTDSLSMIEGIGELVNKKEKAKKITSHISTSFKDLKQTHQTVLYFIWKKPYMVAGRATFIGHLLEKIGLKNSIEEHNSRYPTLSLNDIVNLNPELIFLSSEPYPFKETHVKELQKQLPDAHILIVDGELFSWYGSRLTHSVKYFNELIKILIDCP